MCEIINYIFKEMESNTKLSEYYDKSFPQIDNQLDLS